ncbi:RNA-binding transcriptional accessory protein [Acinetobacter ursingii]|uniref:RNA-binding transcriptional accessory protein n=2 Tax=Acinetobacter ursingii TaxID=108980 RepID=A0A3F3L6Z6_9GAMM|nr:Tex family protein [Acinetobacter ursingii]MDA3578091.1 RNA-binding transcriptional accessory protein [Acinetobacter ursingii]MDG9860148.1 RNA-binding transcriptional accessory protein [Acinetobacter ursingii]MDG9893922.1 RNA-binding transcriptional accessory protein [Acinetobacter ursingii]MDH0007399.1 RNA-binding transcriptional accessory protein [Acinetobacter ursingii]MDH0193210.1 RNA-binding transcriptional accessory protein [Acinetobacter ursingii]
MTDLVQQLASELAVRPNQVEAAIRLIDEGASVPFIARYRKEVTQGLDDTQLRQLDTRLAYLRDLYERREKVIESLKEQDKLSEDLLARVNAAETKNALEEIYAPYRPKRTSKSFKAKEAGLGPAAEKIRNENVEPVEALAGFSHEDYPDVESQLDAVQHIIIDEWAQNIALTTALKALFAKTAILKSAVASDEKKEVGKKFRDYFEFSENLNKVPSHRLLAMLRGRQENVLGLKVDGEDEAPLAQIETEYSLEQIQPQARQDFLKQTAKLFWLGKIRPQIEHSLLTEKRLAAEAEAMEVFAENLRHLLLSAPAGGRTTLGVDPGIRTGVKLAVVSDAGDVLAHSTIYTFAPKEDKEGSIAELARLCREYNVDLIAIGNGTASRETEAVVAEMMTANPDLKLTRVSVSEAGASVYSASELAAAELPELDVSIRGAVSIARRLQDPLAELVKIDPKSIGVGQYQHDVNQTGLAKTLDAVVEDCVNAVGVDVNTASSAILGYIAGLNKAIAQQIVEYRKENGQFENRQALKKVPRLGERTFEQAAGFLRIQNGSEPLDASAVHPESYGLVERIVEAKATTVKDIIGNSEIIRQVKADEFVDDQFGLPTVQDVLAELEKPGRDPRPEFRTAKFREDITEVAQLTEGMQLEGVVTNVTNFGAFVDVGVHQDGLVHISELANEFVSDPHKVVKPGQIVQVRVLTVDAERNRVNLSMRPEGSQPPVKAQRPPRRDQQEQREERKPQAKRPQAARQNDQAKKPQRPKQDKPQDNKIGGFGALLLQAGIKGSK